MLSFFDDWLKKVRATAGEHQKLHERVVQIADLQIEKFNNYIIEGENPRDEPVEVGAWFIVAADPKQSDLFELHSIAGGEKEEAKLLSRARTLATAMATIPVISTWDSQPLIEGYQAYTFQVLRKLGFNSTHIIGMLGFQKTMEGGKEFASLWVNPNLTRKVAEHLIKRILLAVLK